MKKFLFPGVLLLGLIFTQASVAWSAGVENDPGHRKQMLLVEAISMISKEYNVYFTFDHSLVEDIEVEYETNQSRSVEEALTGVLRKTDLKFKLYDRRFVILYQNDEKGLESLKEMVKHFEHIIADGPEIKQVQTSLKPISKIPLNKRMVSAERLIKKVTADISGIVTDQEGEPLIGVNVQVKGTNKGAATDLEGKFELIDVNENATLVISYIGYKTQEVKVDGRTTINITLQTDAALVDEVVVVAFGKQKKTDMVGSVTSISPADLKVPASNLTTALAGQAAGVISYQRSGEPGQDNADFFIRGVTSFGVGKVNPLILIDGVELGVTELARLRPDDIENFSIMKDATATALYGARGANGVIYVTTKEGIEGKAQISFRSEVSTSSPTSNVELADPVTYMELYNEALFARDPFAIPLYSQEKINETRKNPNSVIFPSVDWRDELFKDRTVNHRHNLNVRGGGKIARYYVAGSIAQDNGTLKVNGINNFNNNIDLKTYTLRANVNINLTPSTELVVRLNGNFDDYKGPLDGGSSVYNQVIRSNPVDFLPFYEKDEAHQHINHILFGGVSDRPFINPYANMVKGYRDYQRSLMLAQMEIKQDLDFVTKGLSFRTMFNTNRISRFDIERSYKPFYYELSEYDKFNGQYRIENFNESTGEEFLSFRLNDNNRQQENVFYMESALNYNRTFAEKHSISGLLVNILRSSITARASSLQLSLPRRNFGLSGRLTYSYDERYYGEFNFGYNGSEKFDKNHRYGFFPSVGVAWSISNEDFWVPIKDVVNNLRVRATYGLVGNDAIGYASDRFFYLSNVNMNAGAQGFTFGQINPYSRSGVNVTRYSNPDVTWEVSQKTNLSIEASLFDALNIQADFFTEERTNILMSRIDIPSTMGLTAPVRANVGAASGGGMDIMADYTFVNRNSFWLQVRGNFTYATSQYKVYEEPLYEKEWWLSRIGQPISQQWGYIAERLFIDDEEVANSPDQPFGDVIGGDIKYKDVNQDGQITSLDRVPIGFPTVPEVVYGAGFSVGYKDFDVSVFFQGSARSSFWVDPAQVAPFAGGRQIIKAFADDHYSLENQNTYALWPRLSTIGNQNNQQRSSWWLYNGAFLRVKQAEIGYTFSPESGRLGGFKDVRVYFSGTNLLLFSHFKLWDIEMGQSGLGYPLQRVFNLGVNINI